MSDVSDFYEWLYRRKMNLLEREFSPRQLVERHQTEGAEIELDAVIEEFREVFGIEEDDDEEVANETR